MEGTMYSVTPDGLSTRRVRAATAKEALDTCRASIELEAARLCYPRVTVHVKGDDGSKRVGYVRAAKRCYVEGCARKQKDPYVVCAKHYLAFERGELTTEGRGWV